MGKYDHLKDEMIRRYKAGEPLSRIGDELGVSHATTRKYIKEAGILVAKPQIRKKGDGMESYITVGEIKWLRRKLKEGDKVPVIAAVSNPDALNAHPAQKVVMRYVVRLPKKGEVILMSATQGVGKIEHYTYRDILVAMRRRQEE